MDESQAYQLRRRYNQALRFQRSNSRLLAHSAMGPGVFWTNVDCLMRYLGLSEYQKQRQTVCVGEFCYHTSTEAASPSGGPPERTAEH